MRHCLLLNHYGADAVTQHEDGGQLSSPKLIDPDACMMEWQVAKKKMTIDSTKKKTLLKRLYTHDRESLPTLMKLAELTLIMPAKQQNVRAFSIQNHIETNKRNQLLEKHLNCHMTSQTEGPPISQYDFHPAVRIWKKKVNRHVDNND